MYIENPSDKVPLQRNIENYHTILVAEDDKGLLELLRNTLQDEGFEPVCVMNGAETLKQIEAHNSLRLLILDYSLPDMNGQKLIEEMHKDGRYIPFIIITGNGNEKIAVEMMKLGARDYLIKDVGILDLLPQVVSSALANITTEENLQDAKRELANSEKRYRAIFNNSFQLIWLLDRFGNVLETNKVVHDFYENEEEILGKPFWFWIKSQEMQNIFQDKVIEIVYNASTQFEAELKNKKHKKIFIEFSLKPLHDENGNIQQIIVEGNDITERRRHEQLVHYNYNRMQKAMKGTIDAMTSLVEIRDPYTAGHQRRVAEISCAIARELGLEPNIVEGIHMAGLIHDLGKTVVPAEILSKPGILSQTELELIRVHSSAGYEILKDVDFSWPIAQIIYQHHEKIDGSGYPCGATGEEILLEAKIIAVADAVEAMASHRPYRASLGIETALKEITSKRGILYDPLIVDVCLDLFKIKGFTFS